jgi:hypothetical protein
VQRNNAHGWGFRSGSPQPQQNARVGLKVPGITPMLLIQTMGPI